MPFEIVAPAGVWALAGLSLALVLLAAANRSDSAAAARLRWRAGGFAALGGAAVPSAIQYGVTGEHFWAGALLLAVSVGCFLRSFTVAAAEAPAAFSFREKSAMAGMATIAAVYGWTTYRIVQEPPSLQTAFNWLVISSIMMAIALAASQIVFSLMRKPEEADERDRMVAWRGARNSYFTLAIGAWGTIMLAFSGASAPVLVYALLGAFVCAEFVRLASELAYYRLDL